MKSLRGAISPRILQRVVTLRRIDEALRDCLPAECCSHCRAAGLEGGTLYLVTDSPAWRARLHFYTPRIIRYFNRLGKFSLEGVKIRVARSIEPPPPLRPSGPARKIPAGSARAFEDLARATDDESLRRVLERLSRRR